MSQQFDGKVVLITGGGTGIGKSTTEAFVAKGAKVVVSGRREQPLKELSERFPDAVGYVQADVVRPGDAKKAIEFAVERFGHLDVLVNNAGTLVFKPLAETTDEEIATVFHVNVNGLLSFSRDAIPHLTQTQGSIVNISSTVGTAVMAGTTAYSGAKAAVEQITRVLATELGPAGVRVNAVAPGVTRTDMSSGLLGDDEAQQSMLDQTPLGHIGEPGDVARVVTFLASADAGWVTGQTVAASGGLML